MSQQNAPGAATGEDADVDVLTGAVPIHPPEDSDQGRDDANDASVSSMAAALDRRRGGGWVITGEGEWQLRSTDGTEQAVIRSVGDDYEARVYRHPTGPERRELLLAHGPQLFASAEEALRYCESNVAPRPGEA